MSSEQQLPASLVDGGVRDTRLITRAIRQRWPIPADKRAALIDRQIEIATSKDVSPGESTSAFKAVLAANQQNIEAENRPKRRPPITIAQVIVPGNLAESKRRALALLDEFVASGRIPAGPNADSVLTLSRSDSADVS